MKGSHGAAVLAIESSFPEISTALRIGEEILLPETDLRLARGSALHRALDELLGRAGLGAREISRILVDLGPGSYTGLRIGLALAGTLGELFGVRLLGLYSTDLCAFLARGRIPPGEDFLVVFDARRSHWSCARYRFGKKGRLQRLEGPRCLDLPALQAEAAGVSSLVSVKDAPPLPKAVLEVPCPRAEALFELEGLSFEVEEPAPLYLMPPV